MTTDALVRSMPRPPARSEAVKTRQASSSRKRAISAPRSRLEHAAIEIALVARQLAIALVDDLRRQLGQHLLLRAPQHEWPHEALQQSAIVLRVARQIAGNDEVEQRVQLALVVLDRRAGE